MCGNHAALFNFDDGYTASRDRVRAKASNMCRSPSVTVWYASDDHPQATARARRGHGPWSWATCLVPGFFFTPGELARVAEHPWQVYFIWSLAGLIVLCGALTLGELASLFPRAGATYHIMSEAFGPACLGLRQSLDGGVGERPRFPSPESRSCLESSW